MGSWETAGKGFVNRTNTSRRPSAAGSRPRPHWSPHPPRPAGWGGGKTAASKLQKRRSAQEATLNEPHLLQVHFDLFLRPRLTHSELMLSDLGLFLCPRLTHSDLMLSNFDLFLRPRLTHSELMLSDLGLFLCPRLTHSDLMLSNFDLFLRPRLTHSELMLSDLGLFLRPRRTRSDLMLSDLGLDIRGVRLASPVPTPLPSTGCHLYVLNDWLPALACSMFLHSLAIMECSGCGDHVHPNPFLRGAQGSCGKGLSLLAGVQTFTHLCVRLRTCSGKGLEGIPRKVSREGGWQCRTRRGPPALGQHPSRYEGPRVFRQGGELEAGGGPSSSGLPGRVATELGTALDCGRPVMGFPGLLQGPCEGALGSLRSLGFL
ncbi:uncharacterized protein [Macaca fascicularis]|uniref:uncharacterized protein n=1 Tax=Macaca fascicularis TaxID=9541 RepID=UPI003D15CA28